MPSMRVMSPNCCMTGDIIACKAAVSAPWMTTSYAPETKADGIAMTGSKLSVMVQLRSKFR